MYVPESEAELASMTELVVVASNTPLDRTGNMHAKYYIRKAPDLQAGTCL